MRKLRRKLLRRTVGVLERELTQPVMYRFNLAQALMLNEPPDGGIMQLSPGPNILAPNSFLAELRRTIPSCKVKNVIGALKLAGAIKAATRLTASLLR